MAELHKKRHKGIRRSPAVFLAVDQYSFPQYYVCLESPTALGKLFICMLRAHPALSLSPACGYIICPHDRVGYPVSPTNSAPTSVILCLY